MLEVPPTHAANVAVRSWTDAPPMMAAPVAKIVATARRRTRGPVAHLVRGVSGGGDPVLSHQILIGKIILIGGRELAAPDSGRQPGTFFHDQRVGADVLWCR